MQAMLAVPPPAVESMMKGVYVAFAVLTLAYFPVAVACAFYASFGNGHFIEVKPWTAGNVGCTSAS